MTLMYYADYCLWGYIVISGMTSPRSFQSFTVVLIKKYVGIVFLLINDAAFAFYTEGF